MKKCPFCSAEILDDADFCIYCMRPLSEKVAVLPKKVKRFNRFTLFIIILILIVLISVILIINLILTGIKNLKNYTTDISAQTVTETSSTESGIVSDFASLPSQSDESNSNEEDKDVDVSTQEGSDSQAPISSSDDNETLQTPPSTTEPPQQIPPTQTPEVIVPDVPPETPIQPTWSVNEVDGGVEITGIENYNTSGNYEIPSQIDGKTVVGIGLQAFYYEQNLKSITLPDTLKYIDEQAFANCNSITKITIPASVTEIKNNAFMSCKELSEIYIQSNTVTIATYAFSSSYQRNVPLTIYAPVNILDQYRYYGWGAEYVEWNG